MWGAIIGGAIAIIGTGGAALPVVIGAGAVGAAAGGGIGATAGALGEDGRAKVGFAASVIAMFMSGGKAPAPAQ